MRLSEKTLELTLCNQMGVGFWLWPYGPFPPTVPQPIWFGLTQKQEAQAGFDAAAKIAGGRLLLLQFKAGRKLRAGTVRFTAPHAQLDALQKRVGRHRFIYYVLPSVTETHDLTLGPWVLAQTWFLDVAALPALSRPRRKSAHHNITLNPGSGTVLITSEPVNAQAVRWEFILEGSDEQPLGSTFETFDAFWEYAQLLGPSGAGVCLPAA